MKKENPIDELFRQKFEERAIKPSEKVWDSISAGLERGSGRKKGGAFLRAAVVTVLAGLSTWVYFSNNSDGIVNVQPHIEMMGEKGADKTSEKEKQKEEPDNEESAPGGEEKKREEKSPAKRKIIPIMRQTKAPDLMYVKKEEGRNNEKPSVVEVSEDLSVKRAVDEGEVSPVVGTVSPETLADAGNPDEGSKEEEEQGVERKYSEPKIRLKYTVPVTEKSFYTGKAHGAGEKPKLKERLFAYASDQVENLLNGEAIERPERKHEKDSRVEINLGKLF